MKKINLEAIIVILFLSLFFTFGIPIIINELYKTDKGYVTVWGAADVLSFYAVILSSIITICIFCATIFYSKKDTERQLNFNLSLSCVPFFIIDTVEDNAATYNKNKDNTWEKKIILEQDLNNREIKFKSADDSTLKFNIKNVGEGLALNLFCLKMFNDNAVVDCHYQVVNKESKITIELKLEECLNLISNDENKTNLTVVYQNTSGICFSQEIIIELKRFLDNRNIDVVIPEMSPRKQLLKNV